MTHVAGIFQRVSFLKVDNDVLNPNQVITCSNAEVKFVDQKHFIAFVSEH